MNWVAQHNNTTTLEANTVYVWRIFLPSFYADIARLGRIISQDELASAKKFVHKRDGERYLIAKAFQRSVIAKYLDVDSSALRFDIEAHGKPYLVDNKELQFNLSHSGDFALLAVSKGAAVGVDIERTREKIDCQAIAKRFFSKDEFECVDSLKGLQQVDAFYRCWVKKEAFAKAVGWGVSFPLAEFTVDVHSSEISAVAVHNNKVGDKLYWVMPLKMPNLDKYYAAVSSRQQLNHLVCIDCGSL